MSPRQAISSAGVLTAMPAAVVFCAGYGRLAAHHTWRLCLPATPHPVTSPAWELPARMIVSTGLVHALSTLSAVADPRLAGMLATFPALACALAALVHRNSGPGAAIEVMRGVLVGLLPTSLLFLALTVA